MQHILKSRVFMLTVIVGLCAAGTARAADVALLATHDATQTNEFSFIFGTEPGQRSTAQISDTHFELQVEPVVGSARFVRYDQQIQPLTLPGGYSTGDITVHIVPGSSSGTYDAETGAFSTTEQYEISFTGDLSPIGLFSPVVLPSSSNGTVTGGDNGTIQLLWGDENVQVGPLVFSYTCEVNALFDAALVGDLDRDDDVDFTDFAAFQDCFGGAQNPPNPDCVDPVFADSDGDGDVDMSDYVVLARNFTGAR